MKTINRKRAEIVINNPTIQEDGDCSATISNIISTLLVDHPSYSETFSCSDKCPITQKGFSIVKLHDSFNINFSNLTDAIWSNFPTNLMCKECSKTGLPRRAFAPIVFIEVNS